VFERRLHAKRTRVHADFNLREVPYDAAISG